MKEDYELGLRFLNSLKDEVNRRKKVLDNGLKGVPNEIEIRYGVYREGQSVPKYSAEMALLHLKSIQVYEQCVRRLQKCLDDRRDLLE
tara:strand:+ start:108 stop:371 length:264 start_codon:yes stop_codon:yes gene_type:complete